MLGNNYQHKKTKNNHTLLSGSHLFFYSTWASQCFNHKCSSSDKTCRIHVECVFFPPRLFVWHYWTVILITFINNIKNLIQKNKKKEGCRSIKATCTQKYVNRQDDEYKAKRKLYTTTHRYISERETFKNEQVCYKSIDVLIKTAIFVLLNHLIWGNTSLPVPHKWLQIAMNGHKFSILSAELEITGLSFDLSSTSCPVLPSVCLTSFSHSSYKNVLNSNSAL